MLHTTLCYPIKNAQYLMLHRVKKELDANKDKWIGIGGKFLEGESPEECLLREVKEETGLTLTDWHYRGIVTFVSDRWEGEYMHLSPPTTGRARLPLATKASLRGWTLTLFPLSPYGRETK